MPQQYRCKNSICTTYLDAPGWCPAHAAEGTRHNYERHSRYDKQHRDPEATKFYNQTKWVRLSKDIRAAHPVCQRCNVTFSAHVHHIIPLEKCTEEQKWDRTNLLAVCQPCHNILEAEAERQEDEDAPLVTGMPTLVPDDEYEFDENLATAIPRFAAKFCNHYRGTLKGQPFLLHPVQQEIFRNVYGFVHRQTRHRLIQSLWLESGIGSGKTPLMAICGLYEMLGSGEAGAQIYSVSNSFGQANHMFEAAKTFIKNNAHLSRLVDKGHLVPKQYEIYYRPTDARWHITSGTGAKAGGAASLILADEIHQIENRAVYDDLQGRQSKRDQPLIICATNAAKHPHALYADLHEEAVDTLTRGRRYNRRLFPVIWAAPKTEDPGSPATWRMANPLIGTTIEEAKIRDEWERAQGSAALEARFRLQYLGQPVSDVEKWLDMEKWDACAAAIDPAAIKDAPLYIGLDLSLGDDLCARVDVSATPNHFYATSKFWVPRETADYYDSKAGTEYAEWGKDNRHITLLDGPTVTPDIQRVIATEIIEQTKGRKVVVCYDPQHAGHCVATLAAAGITCVALKQGWTIATGCLELDRRLKERSITIEPNPVMRMCAANAEVKHDGHGNYWPMKPGARGRYHGNPVKKIDGVSALVTALTEARKHDFPKATPHVGAMLIDI